MADIETLRILLTNTLGIKLKEIIVAHGQITCVIDAAVLLDVCHILRNDPRLLFEQLLDISGVDYLTYGLDEWETEKVTGSGFSRGVERDMLDRAPQKPNRFAAAYQLLSVSHNWRIRLRCYAVGEPPQIPSVMPIWISANWYEREAFDLYGILFAGHPDLRRILTDYGFIGHPFRKDFPLSGHVEVRYDPEQKRVIYQPVSIEPRTLVPRVIRRDHRYVEGEVQNNG